MRIIPKSLQSIASTAKKIAKAPAKAVFGSKSKSVKTSTAVQNPKHELRTLQNSSKAKKSSKLETKLTFKGDFPKNIDSKTLRSQTNQLFRALRGRSDGDFDQALKDLKTITFNKIKLQDIKDNQGNNVLHVIFQEMSKVDPHFELNESKMKEGPSSKLSHHSAYATNLERKRQMNKVSNMLQKIQNETGQRELQNLGHSKNADGKTAIDLMQEKLGVFSKEEKAQLEAYFGTIH